MKSFKIITLGCKVNQAESEALAQDLKSSRWRPAGTGEPADLCVINTCAVTRKAAQQSRQAVRRVIHENPGACVVATGCCARTDPAAFAAIEGLNHTLSRTRPDELSALAGGAGSCGHCRPGASAEGDLCRPVFFEAAPAPSENRTRPFFKVQDGCDAFCAYCIVPYARGPSRSLPFEAAVAGLAGLAAAGVPEVVLTGIHLGCYGRDLDPPSSLLQLLAAAGELPGATRVRLSSIEPLELTDAILDLAAASERICRHFHVPLQSGDRAVLERMGRPYTPETFTGRVEAILRAMPEAAVGTDLLVGFPGETPAAFEATCALIERLPLAYLHVFPFSPRPGTAAFDLPDRVTPSVVKERCRQLRQIGRKKREHFQRRFLGRSLPVVVEARRDRETGLLKGISSNYLPVLFSAPAGLMNTLADLRIEREEGGRLFGALLDRRQDPA